VNNPVETMVAEALSAGHDHKDTERAKIGMWIFLLTEMLLFGGLFVIYGMYRYMNYKEFHTAALELNVAIGTINTFILLTSSLTVAMSITAVQRGQKILAMLLVGSTIIFALAFLFNKYVEWAAKFHHGIFPGSPELAERPPGQILYFGLYYSMMGLHGIHVFVGMIVLSFMLVFIARDKITANDFAKLENSALYWHLVDIIWIFLYPLFYLIR
jgi:cytochrome c oxidase subunit 3